MKQRMNDHPGDCPKRVPARVDCPPWRLTRAVFQISVLSATGYSPRGRLRAPLGQSPGWWWLMGLLVVFAPPVALACGPFFPCDYLVYGGRDLQEMPYISYEAEATRILEEFGYGDAMARFKQRNDPPPSATQLLAATVRVARADFEAATKDLPDAAALRMAYDDVRFQMGKYARDRLVYAEESRRYSYRYYPPNQRKPSEPVAPTPLDAATMDAQLALLPPEFAEYLRGAIVWHNQCHEAAIPHFQAVLELPASERYYRSTWAAFMLGKVYAEVAPEVASYWFEETRSLAAAGFSDTLQLADASLFWQAWAEAKAGEFVDSIHHFAEAGDLPELARLFSGNEVDPAIAEDPLCRQIVTASVLASRKAYGAEKWLRAIEKLHETPPLPDGGRLAWTFYRGGAMDLAARCAALAEPGDPYAIWTRGRLALYHGELEEGARLLARAAEALPHGGRVHFQRSDTDSASHVAWSDAAMACLMQGNYTGALTNFLQADHWSDAAFLAERVLTRDELTQYLAGNAGSAALDKPSGMLRVYGLPEPSNETGLRFILARRLARAGAWAAAAPLYPQGERTRPFIHPYTREVYPGDFFQTQAAQIAEALRIAAADATPSRERAQAYLDAAKRIREYGLELMGTELGPDWRVEWGGLDPEHFNLPESMLPEVMNPELSRRIARSAVEPDKRFHYRYIAADYMWQAARLLPDNDPLTAEALYLGGTWLAKRDPEAADRFYKALVRRNPNLLIAQQADELRWFPKEFTDTVLYKP